MIDFSLYKLGILGGGQLGKMFLQNASKYPIHTCVLESDANAPAAALCHTFVQGNFKDYDEVVSFGKNCNLLTVEIEHVNIDALKHLQEKGVEVHPAPEVLEIITDKGNQKTFYKENNIPTSAFELPKNKQDVKNLMESENWTFPFVLKARTGGYDGKGVWVIKNEDDLWQAPDIPYVMEEKVNIAMEVGVIVAGNGYDWTIFDPVEMQFEDRANLLDVLVAPARISEELKERCITVALHTAKSFNLRGVLAVELFVDTDGNVLVNEVAPRPHNSGHHTIEACFSSQYDAHLRGVMGWPFADTQLQQTAVMVNLLGNEGHEGKTVYEGLKSVMETHGAFLHLYGKKTTKPFRKMGHLTLCGDDVDILVNRSKQLKNTIKINAK